MEVRDCRAQHKVAAAAVAAAAAHYHTAASGSFGGAPGSSDSGSFGARSHWSVGSGTPGDGGGMSSGAYMTRTGSNGSGNEAWGGGGWGGGGQAGTASGPVGGGGVGGGGASNRQGAAARVKARLASGVGAAAAHAAHATLGGAAKLATARGDVKKRKWVKILSYRCEAGVGP